MTSKPIIAGTDGSGDSLRAVEWAAREAALRRAPLQIVCVAALSPRMSWHQPSGRPDDVAERRVRVLCLRADRRRGRASELEPELAIETPAVRSSSADSRGSHRRRLDAGRRLPRRRVVLRAGARARPAATPPPTGGARSWLSARSRGYRQGEIVVGVGELDQCDAALGFAFEEADLRGARLVVMHAWSCFVPVAEPGSHLADPERAGTILATSSTAGWPRGWKTCSPAGGKNIQPSKPGRKSSTRIPVTCWPRPPRRLTWSCSAASLATRVGQVRTQSFMPSCTTRAAQSRS